MPGVEDVQVIEAPERERYELRVDGELAAITEYRGHTDPLAFTHTEVMPGFAERGLGTEVIRQALVDVRARGLHVLPVCPFVKAYLARHPDDVDLVLPQHRAAFGLR